MGNIKENELRIGNMVNCVGTDRIINEFVKYGVGFTDGDGASFNSLYAIPLSPKLLERAGFKQYAYSKDAVLLAGSDTYVNTFTLGKIVICDWGDGKFILTNSFSFDFRVEIKTVHHLQNLTFALTGNELPLT